MKIRRDGSDEAIAIDIAIAVGGGRSGKVIVEQMRTLTLLGLLPRYFHIIPHSGNGHAGGTGTGTDIGSGSTHVLIMLILIVIVSVRKRNRTRSRNTRNIVGRWNLVMIIIHFFGFQFDSCFTRG